MIPILLVEDDKTLGETLKERLIRESFEITWVTSIAEARTAFKQSHYKLLLLDIGLPDGSGLSFGRDVRLQSTLPIIFLTAMNSAEFRLEGFEIGADDYIPKPFHLKELILRINKVLALKETQAQNLIKDGLSLLRESNQVKIGDSRTILFSSKDFEVLYLLVSRAPEVIGREELHALVWRGDASSHPRTVDNSIVRIRNLLKPSHSAKIRSVRGVGYQWV